MIDILIDEGVDVGLATDGEEPLPDSSRIEAAVREACSAAGFHGEPELCIRLAGDSEVQALNKQWRGKDAATDVLSFPMQEGSQFTSDESLGDIIVAVPYCRRAAAALDLACEDHMIHLIVHGTLHLLGHDHIDDDEAERMHSIERAAMQRLGLHDPYEDEEGN